MLCFSLCSQPKRERKIKFRANTVYMTYSQKKYDRRSDPDAVFTRLTPKMMREIRQELNNFKLHEMDVHESSKINTQFFFI
ncbi:hypothetical protein BY458DRAFT_528300 [Sporodiniella umbellata]|nr:hypothetical protein BY458DRAFT_528300 [Sporodiniella umbellata]